MAHLGVLAGQRPRRQRQYPAASPPPHPQGGGTGAHPSALPCPAAASPCSLVMVLLPVPSLVMAPMREHLYHWQLPMLVPVVVPFPALSPLQMLLSEYTRAAAAATAQTCPEQSLAPAVMTPVQLQHLYWDQSIAARQMPPLQPPPPLRIAGPPALQPLGPQYVFPLVGPRQSGPSQVGGGLLLRMWSRGEPLQIRQPRTAGCTQNSSPATPS